VYPHIHLGPSLEISTYFLIISLATTLSSLWFVARARRVSLNPVTAVDLTFVALISAFFGARLLHVFYEVPEYYRADWWRIFQVWNGGFVFFGGLVAALVGCTAFCAIYREPFWFWADLAAAPVSAGYALGRLACFFNGCCYGKACDLAWGVYMHGAYRHPTQLYATAYESGVLSLLLVIQPRLRKTGLLFNAWLVLHAIGRWVMEYFRDDPRGDLISGMSLGTMMSLGLGLFGLSNILLIKASRRLA
jgi:phosphatidylglycerol:prolipoprotein diacylglycerol transferase